MKALVSLLIVAYMAPSISATAVEINSADGHGNLITTPVNRIITLAPHLTELVYAAGAGDKLIGVVEYSDFPPAARKLKRIGNATSLDMESIVASHPDLVLAWESGNRSLALHRFTQLGIPLIKTNVLNLKDIADQILMIGKLAGTENIAKQRADRFLKEIGGLQLKQKGKSRLRVFYQIWHQPRLTVNHSHLISKVISLCGGENVFKDLLPLTPQIDMESVIQENPDVIVLGVNKNQKDEQVEEWQTWKMLDAVKNHAVFSIPADLMHRQSPRIMEAAVQLCQDFDEARTVTAGK